MARGIHPTAVIHPSAVLGVDVTVGPHSVIGPHTTIGDRCVIGPLCLLEYTQVGEGNVFQSQVCVGSPPQDLTHRGESTRLVIGHRNTFREGVTVNRGSRGSSVIGSDGYFMAHAHVGHDCQVGNHVILANGATLGGYVQVGDRAFLSGGVFVHQFVRIGTLALVSGVSGVVMDIPPFCTASGPRARLVGLNLVGLKRAGVSSDRRLALKRAYRTLFSSGLSLQEALESLQGLEAVDEVQTLTHFCRHSSRGMARPRVEGQVQRRSQEGTHGQDPDDHSGDKPGEGI